MIDIGASGFGELLRPAPEAEVAPLTKLVCTLGQRSSQPDMLRGLLLNGMRCARLDLATMSTEFCAAAATALREATAETDKYCALVLDTAGPEISIAPPATDPVSFEAGATVTLVRSTEGGPAGEGRLLTRCSLPFTEVGLLPGTRVLVSNYLSAGDETTQLALRVTEVTRDALACAVEEASTLRPGIALTLHGPGVHASLPVISGHDAATIRELKGRGVLFHYLGLSYCRSAADVAAARTFLSEAGLGAVRVVAKIATPEAVGARTEIIDAADAVVVARGTLGLTMPTEKVFVAQKVCLRACNLAGKPVVVTRVVDSMVHAPRPTRAEATDVANLVLDGADAILLGAETFRGADPVGAARTVSAIARQAEGCYDSQGFYNTLMDAWGGFREARLSKTEALASSAVRAASKLGATMILAFTKTGRTPLLLAKYRSHVPILAVVAKGEGGEAAAEAISRQCALFRSVVPVLAPAQCDTGPLATDGTMTDWALGMAESLHLVAPGDRVIVSQCPRTLPDGAFAEAAVVTFLTVGEAAPRRLSKIGSCMDMGAAMTAARAVAHWKAGASARRGLSMHVEE